jgi:hypothetical protein
MDDVRVDENRELEEFRAHLKECDVCRAELRAEESYPVSCIRPLSSLSRRSSMLGRSHRNPSFCVSH